MQQQLDYVLRTVEERGVRFVRMWFTDVLGQLKSFAITPAELENALEEGMTFDGSAIEGFSRVQESDMLAMPDPNTSRSCPGGATTPPSPACSATSSTSRRAVRGLTPLRPAPQPRPRARKGIQLLRRPGDGVLLLQLGRRPEPLDRAGYFDLTEMDMASSLRRQTILTLEAMGIPCEYSHHENAPSQHEIDLRYTDALTMADNIMTFRIVVKEVAATSACTRRSCPSRSQGRTARGCTRTSRCSRATSTRSTTPATARAVEAGQALHRRAAAPRARDHRGHEPDGELVQAAGRRVRGAGLRVLGAQQPVGARAGAAPEARQGELDAHRVPLARPRVQPVPRVLGDARPPGSRASRGLRAAAEATNNIFEMTAD
jgi:hypothetical protein